MKTETLHLAANGWVPNNPALPVVIYRDVLRGQDAAAVESGLAKNGWRPDWRDGVYPYHHYHSTAHEALACVAGSAELMLGGEDGRHVTVRTGDLLLLPAGTGHCRITASEDFLLVGAYPEGQDWDIRRDAANADILASIAAVPLPKADPIGGSLLELWRG